MFLAVSLSAEASDWIETAQASVTMEKVETYLASDSYIPRKIRDVATTFGFEPFTPNNELRYKSWQFQDNFTKFEKYVDPDVRGAGPKENIAAE